MVGMRRLDYVNGSSVSTDLTSPSSSSSSADSGSRETNTQTGGFDDDGLPVELSQPDGTGTPSAPRDVEALIVSSRFVTLRWKEPIKTSGVIVGYSVFYRQEGSERYNTFI